MSTAYLTVLFAGLPVVMGYTLLAGFLRSVGNSVVPLAAMIAASLTNIVLAAFNMIPLPPLDGYRLMGTLLPAGSPFVSRKIAQVCQFIMMALAFTGLLGKGLSYLIEFFMSGIGSAVMLLSGF